MFNLHIKANGGAPVTLESWTGRTFDDLKAATPTVNYAGCRVVIRGTQTDLVDGDALIPNDADDVYIFVTPAKMNAGASEYAANLAYAKEQYHTSDEGAAHFAKYNSQSADVLAELVNSFQEKSDDEVSTLGDALDGVYAALDVLVDALSNQSLAVIGGVSLTQLNAEFDALVVKTKTLCGK